MCEGDLRPRIVAFWFIFYAGHSPALLRPPATGPLPAHDQAFGLDDLEILAGALMFGAVEHAEAHPESPTDAHVRLSKKHRTGVRSPPLSNSIGCGQRVEDDRRPRANAAHKGKAGHRRFFVAALSL